GHAGSRRRVDAWRRTADGDLFRDSAVDAERDFGIRELGHEDGPGQRAVGKDDEQFEWRTRRWRPREAALRVGARGAGLSKNRHLGARDRGTGSGVSQTEVLGLRGDAGGAAQEKS